MDLQNEKLLTQFKLKLQELNQDTTFLDDSRFDFFQKFAMYRSVRLGLNLYGINDPNMDADEMDEIVTTQEMGLKSFREQLKIDPRDYNFAQIRELVDAAQTGLDVTPYLNPNFSADQMHIAKTFQQEGLPGIEQVHPEKSITELINFRNQTRQLMQEAKQIIQSEYGLNPKEFLPLDVIGIGSQLWKTKDGEKISKSLDQLLQYLGPDYINPKSGDSILSYLAQIGAVNSVIYLTLDIEPPANVDMLDANGNTPLLNAVKANNADMVCALINCGARIELRGKEGYTALEMAAGLNAPDPQLLKELIITADNNSIDYSNIYEIAKLSGNSEIITTIVEELEESRALEEHEQYLREQEEEIAFEGEQLWDELESQGLTNSAGGIQTNCFETLKESTMDAQNIAVNFSQILDNPIASNLEDIEKNILENPDIINAKLDNGITPLMISSYWNKPQEVAMLLKYGANANLSSESGDTALIEAARSNSFEISKMLIDHGANVNYTNHEGTSALAIAARTNNLELAQLLIEHGAIVNAPDITGNTPLHYVPLNSQEFAKYLIEHGADVLKQNQHGNYAEVLFQDNLQEYLSKQLDMPVYLELQGVSCNEYEQITESKPGLTLSQIVTLSREALDSSYFHLEQSKKALAEALIFENVDMDSFNKFEAESSNAMDILSSAEQIRESVSTSAVEQTEASENQHGFSHS